jgi:hypothetical protein
MNMRVAAEAILRTASGRSLGEGAAQVTAETLEQFRPDERTVEEASRAFEQLGFAVVATGATLTIEGEPETFERALGLRLEEVPDPMPGDARFQAAGDLRLPPELEGLVEDIVFPTRRHLFDSTRDRGRRHGTTAHGTQGQGAQEQR